MDTRLQSDNAHVEGRELASGEVIAIAGGSGTVIRCLQGQAWVTQEGDRRDYFLAANTRYQSAERGLIVVNALVDHTQIAVSRRAPQPRGDWMRNAVWLDPGFSEAARRRASFERAHYVAQLVSQAWARVRRAMHTVAAIVSGRMSAAHDGRSCQQ